MEQNNHFAGGELTQYDDCTRDLGLDSPLDTPVDIGKYLEKRESQQQRAVDHSSSNFRESERDDHVEELQRQSQHLDQQEQQYSSAEQEDSVEEDQEDYDEQGFEDHHYQGSADEDGDMEGELDTDKQQQQIIKGDERGIKMTPAAHRRQNELQDAIDETVDEVEDGSEEEQLEEEEEDDDCEDQEEAADVVEVDLDQNLIRNKKLVIPEKDLSFAGSEPVVYDENGFKSMPLTATSKQSIIMVNHEVINEVTEPTSPDNYFSDQNTQSNGIKSGSSTCRNQVGTSGATMKQSPTREQYYRAMQSQEHMITYRVDCSQEIHERSDSRSSKRAASSGSKQDTHNVSITQALNLDKIEILNKNVDNMLSEQLSPQKLQPADQQSPSLLLASGATSRLQQNENNQYQPQAALKGQMADDPNQSFPETAMSDAQTAKHVSLATGPKISPDVRKKGVFAKVTTSEKHVKKPSSSAVKSKSSQKSMNRAQKTPKDSEDRPQPLLKPLKEKLASARNHETSSSAQRPRLIKKLAQKPSESDLKMPKLSLLSSEKTVSKKSVHSKSAHEFPPIQRALNALGGSTRTGLSPNTLRTPLSGLLMASNQQILQSSPSEQRINLRPASTLVSEYQYQNQQLQQQRSTFTSRTATKVSQMAFVENQNACKANQERLNQEQRALKLSLLKAQMKEKPTINENSNLISSIKYTDPETGQKVSESTKVQILSQELIKNRPEVIDQMQQILDFQDGLSFRPEITERSRAMHRSVNSLLEWSEKTELKKQQMRELSASEERQLLKLSNTRLTCPGSEQIVKSSQRQEIVRQTGMSISEWLHLQSFEKQKKQEDRIKRVIYQEQQRMKPVLTEKARMAKPQYLDHYIKHKLSLDSVPERGRQTQRDGPKSARHIKKGSLIKSVSHKQLEKEFKQKYTVNEKSVQSKLLAQMRNALQPSQHTPQAALPSQLPPKVQMLHQAGFNRNLLNEFLQTKFITEQEQQAAMALEAQDEGEGDQEVKGEHEAAGEGEGEDYGSDENGDGAEDVGELEREGEEAADTDAEGQGEQKPEEREKQIQRPYSEKSNAQDDGVAEVSGDAEDDDYNPMRVQKQGFSDSQVESKTQQASNMQAETDPNSTKDREQEEFLGRPMHGEQTRNLPDQYLLEKSELVGLNDPDSFVSAGLGSNSGKAQHLWKAETFGKGSEEEDNNSKEMQHRQQDGYSPHSPQIEDQNASASNHNLYVPDGTCEASEDMVLRQKAHQLHQRFVRKVQSTQQFATNQHYSQKKDCVACSSPQYRWAQIVKPNNIYVNMVNSVTRKSHNPKSSLKTNGFSNKKQTMTVDRTLSKNQSGNTQVNIQTASPSVKSRGDLMSPNGGNSVAHRASSNFLLRSDQDDSLSQRLLMGTENMNANILLTANPFQFTNNGLASQAIQLDVENIISPLNKLGIVLKSPNGNTESNLNESADILNEMHSYTEQLENGGTPVKYQPSLSGLDRRQDTPIQQVMIDRVAREYAPFNLQLEEHNIGQSMQLQALVQQKLQEMIHQKLQEQQQQLLQQQK